MKLKALLIGYDLGNIQVMTHLLARAQFEVDVITTSGAVQIHMQHLLKMDQLHFIEHEADFWQILKTIKIASFALKIVVDDGFLHTILNSALADDLKLALLPVVSMRHFSHLCSKAGLAQVLFENRINAPKFRVAQNRELAEKLASELHFPILIKVDFSCAGNGIFECQTKEDLMRHLQQELVYPLLLQEKISGQELDLSAFYQEGHLIYFGYAKIKQVAGRFGPSLLREYLHASYVPKAVVQELRAIGQALGADGFVTISCMQSFDGGRRDYFEADMRPNLWADTTQYIGLDAALAIKKWFTVRQPMTDQIALEPYFPRQKIIPMVFRMGWWEILFNRYQAWQFPFAGESTSKYLLFRAKKYINLVLARVIANIKNISNFCMNNPVRYEL